MSKTAQSFNNRIRIHRAEKKSYNGWEEIVSRPCQGVSVEVCVTSVKVASKGVKSRKKNG